MVTKLAVGAVVFRSDGAVLLVRRARPPLAGSWTLPGGKVEPGETLEAAVAREIAEETGLAVTAFAHVETLVLEREGFAYEIHDFACRLDRPGDPRAADDVDAARWVLPTEIATLDLTPEVIRVIARARSMK
ncbi:MAG TPA: NUDIX hydrolase [Polyangiaceae bacterium]